MSTPRHGTCELEPLQPHAKGQHSNEVRGQVTWYECIDWREGVAAPLEPTLELGFMRSEIKMAIPRLRQDDIEWLIANFRSSAEAYAAAVSKNRIDKYAEMEAKWMRELLTVSNEIGEARNRILELEKEIAALRETK